MHTASMQQVASRAASASRAGAAPRRAAARCALQVGDTAPNFSLKDQNGATVSLKSLQPPIFGKEVVLFFYPNDGSPGCTKQANAFRDAVAEFKALGAVVVGVSNGSQESHKEFQMENGLPFALLADEEDAVREAYEVKPALFGALPGRETFVIGKDGKIKMAFNDLLAAPKHAAKALEALESANVPA